MKHDLKKEMKPFFTAPKGRFELVTLPAVTCLSVSGHGDPNTSPDYAAAVQALFTTAYGLKFMSKAKGMDYSVPPLEGLWWSKDPKDFLEGRKDRWDWQMLIMIPPFVDRTMVDEAILAARRKKPELTDKLTVETIEEGECLQTLHLGPYANEGPVLQRLHDQVMPEGGWTFNGKHHEIYLSDPGRTAPEKLKTILRQPVKRIA